MTQLRLLSQEMQANKVLKKLKKVKLLKYKIPKKLRNSRQDKKDIFCDSQYVIMVYSNAN